MRMETPAPTPCEDACDRIRIALLEDDLEQAQRNTENAIAALNEAQDALLRARSDLARARRAEWARRSDLYRAKRTA